MDHQNLADMVGKGVDLWVLFKENVPVKEKINSLVEMDQQVNTDKSFDPSIL